MLSFPPVGYNCYAYLPESLGGICVFYFTSCSYNSATLRALNILVEASTKKHPPQVKMYLFAIRRYHAGVMWCGRYPVGVKVCCTLLWNSSTTGLAPVWSISRLLYLLCALSCVALLCSAMFCEGRECWNAVVRSMSWAHLTCLQLAFDVSMWRVTVTHSSIRT